MAQEFKGSSPRMRGALEIWILVFPSVGIIPAYAGSTCATQATMRAARDHPRVCGEHASESATIVVWSGSSPRMRGAQVLAKVVLAGDGIIPAYTGSTFNGC